MNKTSKIIIIVLSIVTVLAIIGGVYIHVLRDNTIVWDSSDSVTTTVEPEGELKDLSIITDYANLTISRGSKLSVSYSLPQKLVPKVELSNGKLTIESPKNTVNVLSLGGKKNYYISLTIPESTELGQVNIGLDAGNVNIDGLIGEKVVMELDAGNMNLNNSSAKTLEVELDAGNLELTGCTIHRIAAELDAGNIEAKDCTIEEGSCETDLGNIDLSGEIGSVTTKTSLGKTSIN